MERKCIICGGSDKLVDVYKPESMQYFSGTKQDAGKPTVYCNDCFMTHVWNTPEKPQEAS